MKNSGTGFYYVYALKDPRANPARPFYIGKGTGSRAEQHLLHPERSLKASRIHTIRAAGFQPIVEVLVSDLTEPAALKLEAELIAAFGTEASSGLLTNEVVPTGRRRSTRADVVVPSGSLEKAQVALALLKSSVLDLVRANPRGISNADVTNALGLQSDYQGRSLNYLAYSVLGLLLRDGSIIRKGLRNAQKHFASGL